MLLCCKSCLKPPALCKTVLACSSQIDLKPDPGFERCEEPHPVGADAPCGGGEEPWRRPGSCGPIGQCFYPDVSLQETLFHLLVKEPHREDEECAPSLTVRAYSDTGWRTF